VLSVTNQTHWTKPYEIRLTHLLCKWPAHEPGWIEVEFIRELHGEGASSIQGRAALARRMDEC
jgi:hypothetical protein